MMTTVLPARSCADTLCAKYVLRTISRVGNVRKIGSSVHDFRRFRRAKALRKWPVLMYFYFVTPIASSHNGRAPGDLFIEPAVGLLATLGISRFLENMAGQTADGREKRPFHWLATGLLA